MTTTNDTRDIYETFEFTDEAPLVSNDWLSLTGGTKLMVPPDVASGICVGDTAGALVWKDKTTVDSPKSPDQQVIALGYTLGRNLSDTIASVSQGGANTVFTLATKMLSRPIGFQIRVTIAGVTGLSPPVNGTFMAEVLSSKMVQIIGISIGTADVTSATIAVEDCYFGVWSRLDDVNVTPTTFGPTSGYFAKLAWDLTSGGANKITCLLYREDHVTVGLRSLAESANLEGTASIKTGPLDTVFSILQELRMTVIDEPDGGTRIRVYVNNDDDVNPEIDYIDRISITPKGPGLWGFELGSNATGIDAWYGSDKVKSSVDDVHAGRTLLELREDVQLEVARGTNTSTTDKFFDRGINRAIQYTLKRFGGLALWMEREELITLTSDDTRTIELPTYMKSIGGIFRASDRSEITHLISLIGYNKSATALRFHCGMNLNATEVFVRYSVQYDRLVDNSDRCPIPEDYDELVVIGAAMSVARKTGDQSWMGTLNAYYATLLHTGMSAMGKLRRLQRTKMRVPLERSMMNGRYSDPDWFV